MAHVFRLANEDQTHTIDLLAGTFKLVDQSWQTSTTDASLRYDYTRFGAQPTFQNYQPVAETFILIGVASVADLLQAHKELEDVAEDIRKFHDSGGPYKSWWLEWNADGEEPKRALIYTLTMDYQTKVAISPFMECATSIVKMALTRHAMWENTDYIQDSSTLTFPDTLGLVGDKGILAPVEGTAPGRINLATVYAASTPWWDTEVYEYWLGIRPTYDGIANFDPLWQAENGTMETDTAVVGDATCSMASRVRCTFATDTTLVRRFYIQLQQLIWAHGGILDNALDYKGRYLVLARARLSAAGTVGVQLKYGYTDNMAAEEIYIDSTSWYLYELGQITIPPWLNEQMSSWWILAASYQLSIFAERLSGTPSLDVDYLFLVPSEYMLHVKGSQIAIVAGRPTGQDDIFTLEDDTVAGYGYTPAASPFVNDALELIPTPNWYVPQEGGALVAIGQRETEQVLGDTIIVSMTWYPRWLSYRLDETT